MNSNVKSKIIRITDIQRGLSETEIIQDTRQTTQEDVNTAFGGMYEALGIKPKQSASVNLLEAFIGQPEAGLMFADGVRYLAFSSYRGVAQTFPRFCQVLSSDRPDEQYLGDATLGTIPESPSGTPAPSGQSTFAFGVNILNKRYALQVGITGDDLRYSRMNKIAQIATEMGRSGRTTEEKAVYAALCTAANYTRNSTTKDNDVGANTSALTFSAAGLEQALSTISTAKDRNSEEPLGLVADTLIVPPRLEFAARQLLQSGTLARVGGSATNEVYGGGTINPFTGMLRNIIVSPWFGTMGTNYGWALLDSTAYSMIFQRVEPFNVAQVGENTESRLINDQILYVISGIFGVGIVDDRAMFLSTSTTAPVVG